MPIENLNSIENTNELVMGTKNGRSDNFLALANLFRDRIISIAYSFNISDNEREDLIQEGYIALYKAALTYDGSKGAAFSTYVTVCAKRRMINWVEKNFKSGISPLPLSSFEDSELDKIAVSTENLEDDVILKTQVAEIMSIADKLLSSVEKKIFDLYIKGYSSDEICEMLDVSKKSYNNALFRIRTKLRSVK
jgi:RNA polymerase sporulation-specific sigma factor